MTPVVPVPPAPPTDTVPVWLTLGALAALLAFSLLALTVTAGKTQAFDRATVDHYHNTLADAPATADAVRLVTRLGNRTEMASLLVVVGVAIWIGTRKIGPLLFLLLGAAMALVLNEAIKDLVQRPRPNLSAASFAASGWSFPSGHAMGGVVAWSLLALVLAHRVRPLWSKGLIFVGAACIIVAIGFSRVYLGVHYPSDILGGFLAGLAWLLTWLAVCGALARLVREVPPPSA